MGRKGIPSLDELFPRIPGKCGNCKKDLPKYARRWCSHECSHDAYMRTNSAYMRSAVHERDKGICIHCGWDTDRFTHVLKAMHRFGHGDEWGRSKYRNADQMVYRAARQWIVDEVFKIARYNWRTLWEGDHIIPLAEGGKHELSNMRTLCFRCHKKETKALAGRLAAARKAQNELDKLVSESDGGAVESTPTDRADEDRRE